MRSIMFHLSVLFLLLFSLNGCSHYELPFVSGTKHQKNTSGTVDVRGVNDGVNSQQVLIKRIPFPAEEYSQLKTVGNGTVQGSITITYNGQVIPGRQTKLYLNPVTSYSNQWYRESYLAGHKMSKSDPRLANYIKVTASDNSGKFAFYAVPAGRYYVVGTVRCDACGGKNIRIARKVTIGSSGTVTIRLNKTL